MLYDQYFVIFYFICSFLMVITSKSNMIITRVVLVLEYSQYHQKLHIDRTNVGGWFILLIEEKKNSETCISQRNICDINYCNSLFCVWNTILDSKTSCCLWFRRLLSVAKFCFEYCCYFKVQISNRNICIFGYTEYQCQIMSIDFSWICIIFVCLLAYFSHFFDIKFPICECCLW